MDSKSRPKWKLEVLIPIGILILGIIGIAAVFSMLNSPESNNPPTPMTASQPTQVTSSPSPVPSPTAPFPTAPSVPSPTLVPADSTYKVQEGDTLSSIAATFGVSVENIMILNGLQDDLIFPEQILLLSLENS